ncbi:MAG: type ISP restriction/modification enzyme [Syntrophales bacterium]|nr:type ISP restriction/modification enzyme [Syntrophales bacterium]
MSLQLIQEYHHKVQEILQYGGSRNETAIRPAFQKLLEQYCTDKKIELILELHLGYEKTDLYPLKRIDKRPEPGKPPLTIKAILKADQANRTIQLDSVITLKGVPPAAWEYRLGNRSAIEWVIEYHKERKPKDPTIREKFNAYRFADHKEKVIDLLQRVCTVSVETMNIIRAMKWIRTDDEGKVD